MLQGSFPLSLCLLHLTGSRCKGEPANYPLHSLLYICTCNESKSATGDNYTKVVTYVFTCPSNVPNKVFFVRQSPAVGIKCRTLLGVSWHKAAPCCPILYKKEQLKVESLIHHFTWSFQVLLGLVDYNRSG